MKKFVDHYRILGVKKSASDAEIRKAYLNLAKANHPDRGGSEAKMNRINEAYEILKDVKARELYDEIHRARYSPDGALNMYFTDMMSEAGLREQIVTKSFQDIKRFGTVAVLGLTAIYFFYAYTDSAFYLALLVPVGFLLVKAWLALRQLLVNKPIKPRQFVGKKWPSGLLNRLVLVGSALICLVGVTMLYHLAGNSRDKKLDSIPSANIYESEISEIEKARKAVESCSTEFTEIGNRLNILNQQVDQVFSQHDAVTYNRLKASREELVDSFASKRAECAQLQAEYNQKLNDFRKVAN